MMKQLAGRLANSPLFARGRDQYEQNSKNFGLQLSKLDKVLVGGYMILRDYAAGIFPPTFEDQSKAYLAEQTYHENLAGVDTAEFEMGQLQKPFWNPWNYNRYSGHFLRIWKTLEDLGVKPGSRLLELGCGAGWTAEFLATAGYRVTGTTISAHDVKMGNRRVEALKVKGWPDRLDFVEAPMEAVVPAVADRPAYDGVFVYEALHHAFDWKVSLAQAFQVLRPGGWLLLANEPNKMHTFISYRIGRLSKTHEIGMSQRELVYELKKCGFTEVRILQPRLNNRITEHWIAARRA